MTRTRFFLFSLAAVSMLAGWTTTAVAAPDAAGMSILEEPNGFPPACDAPCFRAEKSFEVYLDGNPMAPGVCAAGENTFVYTITHLGGTGPFIPALTKYEVAVPNTAANVTSAGFIPGPLDPSATTIDGAFDVVTWDFLAPTIAAGQTSSQLFLCSPQPPGGVTETMISVDGQANLDASGTCVGPVEAACELEIDKKCCLPQPALPDLDLCEGDVIRLLLKYTADKCSASDNDQGKKFYCSGDKSPGSPVDISPEWFEGNLQITPSQDVLVGDVVELTSSTGTLGDDAWFHAKGDWWKKQTLGIHTSCSRALRCGDQFGAFELVGLETTGGGFVDCTAPPPEPSCDVEGDPVGTSCDSKVVDMVFEYQGQDCQNPLGNPQGGAADCDGDATGAVDVGIVYAGWFGSSVQVSPASNVNDGDLVRVTITGGLFSPSDLKLLVTDDNDVLQKVELRISCSQPLALGDEFGSFRLVEFTTKNGTEAALPPPVTSFDACELPLAPPKPHCTSDLHGLTLMYVGNLSGQGCTVSNSQGGYASCNGVDDPGEPVTVTPESGLAASPSDEIEVGDLVSLAPSSGGDLPGLTDLDVAGPGGAQSLQIKTSCHKPLSLGDRFGSFVVFGMDREDDGPISLGGQVIYEYEVTNPNASQADNVEVTDSELGLIAAGASIPAGQSVTFGAMATLTETTTNIATVTGDVGGSACEVGMDEVTVTADGPPMGPFSCSVANAFTSLTLIWDGSEKVDVKVWDGSPGGTQLAYIDNLEPGEQVTVSGFTGSTSIWQIYDRYGSTLLGESKFVVTCEDDDMNGVEDCGKPAGDGDLDEPQYLNDWLLEGIEDDDESLVCSPPPDPDDDCGLGPELALLLPGLLWLHRRRLAKSA